jgi:hypothetical protein
MQVSLHDVISAPDEEIIADNDLLPCPPFLQAGLGDLLNCNFIVSQGINLITLNKN